MLQAAILIQIPHNKQSKRNSIDILIHKKHTVAELGTKSWSIVTVYLTQNLVSSVGLSTVGSTAS
jgi:hypothetical protein